MRSRATRTSRRARSPRSAARPVGCGLCIKDGVFCGWQPHLRRRSWMRSILFTRRSRHGCATVRSRRRYPPIGVILTERHYAPGTTRAYLSCLAHFARWVRRGRHSIDDLDHTIGRFIDEHLPRCTCPSPAQRCRHQVRAALQHLRVVLGTTTDERDCGPIEAALQRYDEHMQEVRGLARSTRLQRLKIVDALVREAAVLTPTADQLRRFIAQELDRVSPASGEVDRGRAAQLPALPSIRRRPHRASAAGDRVTGAMALGAAAADAVALRCRTIARCVPARTALAPSLIRHCAMHRASRAAHPRSQQPGTGRHRLGGRHIVYR